MPNSGRTAHAQLRRYRVRASVLPKDDLPEQIDVVLSAEKSKQGFCYAAPMGCMATLNIR